MNSVALVCPRILRKISYYFVLSRKFCDYTPLGHGGDDGFDHFEESLKTMWKFAPIDANTDEIRCSYEIESCERVRLSLRQEYEDNVRMEARRVLEILLQDGPGFDARSVLDESHLKISELLVREVLFGILKSINHANKKRFAKMGFKFFVWSSQQENYRHSANTYHLIMKIFAECEEFRAIWRLVDEMIERGLPTTAQTFNILIRTCGEAGLAKEVVEMFIKSKTFNYRPFKNSFSAILHSLFVLKHYKLIEWVYQQMLLQGHSPDVLTYNIILFAKYRLGDGQKNNKYRLENDKLGEFHRLLDEMSRNGISPDCHTYNILLHVLGKRNQPLAARNLLTEMKEMGLEPSVLHFTTLVDGLSRAGNLDACKYFFSEMIKYGCTPDVVSYTVMIRGYVLAGELEKARETFNEMIVREQVPNVFTYNSMIHGLCMARKFDEACSMLKEMELRGCNPNFLVYSTLVNSLYKAGKLAEADEIIRQMVQKGKYVHLLSKLKRYKRWKTRGL